MQSQTRRFLIIGGIVLAMVLIVVVTTLVSRKDPYQSTCTTFIKYVAAQDASKSYAMFSANARTNGGSEEQWSAIVKSWYNYYFKAVPKLIETSNLTRAATNDTPNPSERKELQYELNAPASKVLVNCYVVKSGSTYQIDAYATAPAATANTQSTAQ